MIQAWIAAALLAGSWLLGLDYFYPASPWAWSISVGVAVILMAKAVGGSRRFAASGGLQSEPSAAADGCGAPEEARCCRCLPAGALILLLPAVWYASWPYRAAPLLIVFGLAIQFLPLRKRWLDCLTYGSVAAGIMMFVQALALESYAGDTAYSHELPWPLPDLLGGVASLLGMDATVNGSTVVVHSMRQVHRLGATWELLVDPATFLFFVGGLTMLGLAVCRDIPAGRRWSAWLRSLRILTLIVLCWLPVRAGLLMAVYVHRVLRSDAERPLHVMNHFFSPWLLLLLLVVPVLLAWRFVRLAAASTRCGVEGESLETVQSVGLLGTEVPSPCAPAAAPSCLMLPAGLIALAVALFTVAIFWNPIGARRDGRVMFVERHSTWEPTTRPYDTKWFGEPSGYNYAAIYDYLGQYYQMSRLLEKDKIDDETLGKCDVLIIKTPTARFSQPEVDAVARFVEQGGGLLLIGDHTNYERSTSTMNDITRQMGFIFRDDLLFSFNESPYRQFYVPAALPHPIVQHMPSMDFAVSCSVDPGFSRGRPVVVNTSLWSMGPEYHHENFHPVPQHCAEMCYGSFIQVWAAWFGQGRAVAFADSTIFSNFCVFQPGKAEMMLGLVEWLNHGNPLLDPRPWLLLLGLPPLAAGLWMASVRQKTLGGAKVTASPEDRLCNCQPDMAGMWLVLLAAGTCGWVAASLAVGAAQHRAMPTPECVRPELRVVIDRTISSVPLSKGPDTQGANQQGYGLLEQWIARTGCYTVRKEGAEAFSGDALVVICPSRSVSDEFRQELIQYVADGGKLLVIDSPENSGSRANSLLWPFGLSIQHDRTWKGKLTTTAQLPLVDVASANQVTGGKPVAKLDKMPVGAAVKYGKGSVMALGFGSLWNDKRMGEHWMLEPDAKVRARYDVLFGLLRPFLEIKPPPTSPPQPAKKSSSELPLKESGPAEL